MTLAPLTLNSILITSLGGAMIGLAAGLLLLGTGRIAGISGIFGSFLLGKAGSVRLQFLIGLIGGAWLVWLSGVTVRPEALAAPNWPKVIFAGLLVGIGTQIGNGCTSGHGVCGLSNFSGRSLSAVLIFMLVAIAVVTLGFGGLSK